MGLSAPTSYLYHDVCIAITKNWTIEDRDIPFPNPLILGGSCASGIDKHERLCEQLDWAERHGTLNEALAILKTIPHEDWGSIDEPQYYGEPYDEDGDY